MTARPSLPFDPIRRAAQLWEGRWGAQASPGAMAVATSIMRAQQLLLAQFDAALTGFDLTFARYEALVLLAFSQDGRLPMSKVGQRLMVHPTSASHIVQRLQMQGFVDRIPNPADGRGTLAAITTPGRAVMEAATGSLVELGFGLEGLTEPELAELFRLLEKLRRSAGDFSPSPSPSDPRAPQAGGPTHY
ncbi:MAG TPA: MarR family transcriptional regulator [Dermatophilaceae bacterium]|nr:MarR family transcriptional regulator [Dermatophilaceae bacterium]